MTNWDRVKGLFHSALEREPAERAAFLRASCVDETDLRQEVERLLAAHDHAAEFIEQSPVSMAGQIVGHYKLERLVGMGGMGQVYVARDLDLGRSVAIKIALGSDADSQARLRREAQHASRLNHPNICTIHEVGDSGAVPYIVMEFVEGRRLSDVIPAEGLSILDLQRYGSQIADALAHAHRHGVLHRDLKAANVVVTPDGRAKVLDFGLARRLSAESLKDVSQSQESVTGESTVAGTLACMAPEQFRGAPADPRTDVWALGVLLYEMATGRRPFTGATGFLLSAAILHEAPASLPETLPHSFRAIVTRCLEKEPGARYQSAEAVRQALDAPLANAPVPAAAAPKRLRRSPSPGSRWSWWWWCGVAALFLAALAIGFRYVQHRNQPVALGASGRPAIAVMKFDTTGGQEVQWLSQGIPSMLLTGLAQSRGLDIVSIQRLRESAKQRGINDLGAVDETQAGEVARHAGAGAIVTGTVYKAGTDVRIDARVEDLMTGRVLLAQSVRGPDVFALVDQLAARIRSGVGLQDDPAIRRVADVSTSSLDAFRLFSQGVDAYIHARGDDAHRALEEAVRIDPAFAEAYMQLASVSGFRGLPGDRRSYLNRAAEHADRLSEPRRLLLNLQLARDGNVSEARRLVDEIVSKFPETEEAYTIAGLVYGEELREKDRLLEIMQIGVTALPNSPSVRNNYGYVLLERGQYADALVQFEKYVELVPREANPYDSLADGQLTSGSAANAIETYSRGLGIDPAFNSSRIGLSWSFAVLGRYDEALATKPPLKLEEAYLVSRLGRYDEADKLLVAGRQRAEHDQNPADESLHLMMSSALALERGDHAQALQALSAADRAIAGDRAIRRNRLRVLIQLLSGLAELGAGRADAARKRLTVARQLYRPVVEEEEFWYQTLEGETALADGDLERASAAFAAAEPGLRKPMRWGTGSPTILANSFPFRDGAARVAIARGDLRGAVGTYRRLLTYDANSKFIGVVEPRYVLALARLLEKAGDRTGALAEYERFLELWKRADSELPELAEARRAVARLARSG
jgi:tetratricopeptide (TPR) repeat protein/TolB-like protein